MSSLRDIRLALKRRLETINGLRAYDVWPATINPPVAIVRPLSGTFTEDFGGSVKYAFEISLLLQLGNLQSAQEQLDLYITAEGHQSILCALTDDPNLGGVADSTSVIGWRDYGTMRIGTDEESRSPEFMGVHFDVEVMA